MTDLFEENIFSFSGIIKIYTINKSFLLSASILVAIFSMAYALSLPNIYTAEAVLHPSKQAERGSASSLGGSGLADLVGLGGTSSSDRTSKSLKILESKDFFTAYYEDFYYLSRLAAVKNFDPALGQLIFDESKVDFENAKWIDGQKPTFESAHKNFLGLLSIDHDRLDGFITITLDHESPNFAKEWLDIIIIDLNDLVKSIETIEASNRSEYLTKQIATSDAQQLNTIFSSMLIEAYETLMLSEISDQFALTYIDKPRIPQIKSKPSRGFVSMFLFIVGMSMLSALMFFFSANGKYINLTFRPFRFHLSQLPQN